MILIVVKFTMRFSPLCTSEVVRWISLLTSGRAKVGLGVLGGDLCEVRGSKGILDLGCVCLS